MPSIAGGLTSAGGMTGVKPLPRGERHRVVDQRELEQGTDPGEVVEARAADLGAALDVDRAEHLAELDVVAGGEALGGEVARRADVLEDAKSSSPPTGAAGSTTLDSCASSSAASTSAASRSASAPFTRSARSEAPDMSGSSSACSAGRSSSSAFFRRPCSGRSPCRAPSARCAARRTTPRRCGGARRRRAGGRRPGSSPRARWEDRTRSGSSRRSLRSITLRA